MSSRKTFSAVVTAAALAFTLSACSADDETAEPAPSPSATATEEPTVEMFEVGEISFSDFEERVVAPNQAIKTLKVKSTAVVSSGETTQETVSEGVVDQTDPDNLKFHIDVSGDMEYSVIQVDGRQYFKEGKGDWVEESVDSLPVTTSTSLFKELGSIEGPVTKVEYFGVEDDAHKFTLDVNVDSVMGTAEGVFGDTVMVVWLNDDYELVKLDSTISVNGVKSEVLSEQSDFNEPVTIEAPELG